MSIFRSRSREAVLALLCAAVIGAWAVAVVTAANTETPPPMPGVAPSQLVDDLARATAAGSWDEAASVAADLSVWGDDALPAISKGLRRGDEELSRMLLRSLWGIKSDGATSLLVSVVTPASGEVLVGEALGRLANRGVSRPLTPLEFATLTRLILSDDLYSPTMAGAAARVLGNCREVPAERRAAPILARFIVEIPRVQPGDEVPRERYSYVSPRVFRLNKFLLAFSYIGTEAISLVSEARQGRAADPEMHEWLTLALGMAGDPEVAGELEQMVREETDTSTRIEAIRAYSRSAGEAAIPLLVSLLDDMTVTGPSGCARTGTEMDKEYPIRMVASDELSGLGRADLWKGRRRPSN